MKRTILMASTAAAIAALVGPGAGQAQETWDLALAYPSSNYHSENAAAFAERVTERTDGELEIVTHAGGSLFSGDAIFPSVRRGLAPMGERLMSALGNENALFEIDSVPFLATSFDESRMLYEAARPALEDLLDEMGLVHMYSVPWPPQGLYSTNPVESLSDMEGVPFRAYNPTTSRIAELMGASPTQIEEAELSQAFATGVAESMISSGSTGYDRQIWEHVDYWYDIQAWLPTNMVFVNKDSWEGLDEETRAIIEEEAEQAEADGWAEARELADWYKEQLAAEGMTIEPPNDELAAQLAEIGDEMSAQWLDRAGDVGQEVLDRYEEMRD